MIRRVKPDQRGEIQLTDAIQLLCEEGRRVMAVKLASGRKALRHRQFPELFRELRGIRAGRPGIRRGIPPRAGAPAGEIRRDGLSRTRTIISAAGRGPAGIAAVPRRHPVGRRYAAAGCRRSRCSAARPCTATSGSTSRRCCRRSTCFGGARPGWPLRLLDARCTRCWPAGSHGGSRAICGREREGLWAAALLGFFLIFDFPSAVIPVASDLLMLAPHLAAVWLAWRGRAVLERRAGGRGVLDQPQGRVRARGLRPLGSRRNPVDGRGLRGGAAPWRPPGCGRRARWRHIGKKSGRGAGSTPASTFVAEPVAERPGAHVNWMGFHAAMVVAAAWFLWRGAPAAALGCVAGCCWLGRSGRRACGSFPATTSCCCRSWC